MYLYLEYVSPVIVLDGPAESPEDSSHLLLAEQREEAVQQHLQLHRHRVESLHRIQDALLEIFNILLYLSSLQGEHKSEISRKKFLLAHDSKSQTSDLHLLAEKYHEFFVWLPALLSAL